MHTSRDEPASTLSPESFTLGLTPVENGHRTHEPAARPTSIQFDRKIRIVHRASFRYGDCERNATAHDETSD
jgi:hypothetical protein